MMSNEGIYFFQNDKFSSIYAMKNIKSDPMRNNANHIFRLMTKKENL